MSCLSRLAPGLVGLLLIGGCAKGAYGPSLETPVTPAPRPINKLTVEERRALLEKAQVWQPIDTARLNLRNGPPGPGGFRWNEKVSCEFDFPKEALSGATPKFECALTPRDTVKVKYGRDNGEVFAEVAGTRLFWALGFAADRMYPVVVVCRNCPENPHRTSTSEWGRGKGSDLATRTFELATIERKFAGKDVEVPGYTGWGWGELDAIGADAEGASRAHLDALKLLAVFIQHVDSKPEQQAIVCPPDSIGKDREGNATCARPFLVVKDLGSSFAAASRFSFPKMKLESWRSVRIWKDEKSCRGDLTASLIGTLEDPVISEAGRRFLADRLNLLSDRQIADLFSVARVEQRPDEVDGRQSTVADWVAAFKEKRAQIVQHRCAS